MDCWERTSRSRVFPPVWVGFSAQPSQPTPLILLLFYGNLANFLKPCFADNARVKNFNLPGLRQRPRSADCKRKIIIFIVHFAAAAAQGKGWGSRGRYLPTNDALLAVLVLAVGAPAPGQLQDGEPSWATQRQEGGLRRWQDLLHGKVLRCRWN